MKKLFTAFGLLLALSACTTEQAPPPAHTAHGLPTKIALDVQVINLADRSGMQPASSPYNSSHFSPTISDAIKQWAADRLQAGGQTGQAIIVVKDASLIAQPMPVTQGIDGWFTRQQGVKYIGRAEVSIEANGRPGFAMADAVATRTVTLPENPTALEKQDAYFSLLNGLMKDLGQNLETGIQTHMGGFIVSPQVYGVTAVPTGDLSAGNEGPVIIQSPTVPVAPVAALPNPAYAAPNAAYNSAVQNSASGNPMYQGTATYNTAPYNTAAGAPLSLQTATVPAVATYATPAMAPAAVAVAAATVPAPSSVAVSPPTLLVSQASMTAPLATAPTCAPAAADMNMPMALAPVATVAPQAPVFGNNAVPTVSELASSPASFGQAADAAQAPMQAPQMQQAQNYYQPAYRAAPAQVQAPAPEQPATYAVSTAPAVQQIPAVITYPAQIQPLTAAALPQPDNGSYATYAAAAPMPAMMPAMAPRGAPVSIPLSGPGVGQMPQAPAYGAPAYGTIYAQ